MVENAEEKIDARNLEIRIYHFLISFINNGRGMESFRETEPRHMKKRIT